MVRLCAVLTTVVMFFSQTDIYEIMWNNTDDEVRKTLPVGVQAHACGMSENEFEYLAQVIEAESDRSDDIEGKILIAAVILNRVADDRFSDSIEAVLNEPGQFSTTSEGQCTINYTQSSRWAIVEAQRGLAEGEIPEDLLYFNCIGYNMTGYCIPYDYVGGNYFMTA